MIDRLVHHSEILSLKGDSYRLRDKDLAPERAPRPPKSPDRSPSGFSPRAPEGPTGLIHGAQLARTGLIPGSSALSASLPNRSEPREGEESRQGGAFSTGEGGQFSTGGASPRGLRSGHFSTGESGPLFKPALTHGLTHEAVEP